MTWRSSHTQMSKANKSMPWRAWSPKGAFFARCPRSFSRSTCGWSWLSRRLLVAADRQTSGCPRRRPDGVLSWHLEEVRTNNSRGGNKVTLPRVVMNPLPLAGGSFWEISLESCKIETRRKCKQTTRRTRSKSHKALQNQQQSKPDLSPQ